MYNITLICTKDVEFGKCNSNELLNLIEENRPDIIFEELSQTSYKECYEQDRKTLVSTAIKMYMEHSKIKHIPVVSTELSSDVYEKDAINKQHRYYSSIISRLYFLTTKHGFNFLNSVYCDNVFGDVARIEQEITENSTNDILLHIYTKANESIDNYENSIIENIYNYSSNIQYNSAVVLIGAWHRKSMIQKIKEYDKNEKFKLNWTFYDGEENEKRSSNISRAYSLQNY